MIETGFSDTGRRPLKLIISLLIASGIISTSQQAIANPAWQRVDVVRDLIGDAEPKTSGLTLNLPLVSDDGAAVALTVKADPPADNDSYVQSIYLFATGNPNPEIAEFHFTPHSGRAEVSTRVRLNESQTVLAVARTSDNQFRIAVHDIRVTISGCLARADSDAGPAMDQPRLGLPRSIRNGQIIPVRTLINHPMETGLREDAAGNPVPRRIIENLHARLDGETVFQARLHQAISANPYVLFHLKAAPGQLEVIWTEDSGTQAGTRAAISIN